MSQREATVQGEVHAAESDKRALLERGLEEYDAVLVEGRSPTLVVRKLTIGYAAFLMGYVTLMWVQAVVARLRAKVAGGTSLRAAVEAAGVDYHDRIDADTAAVYEMVPRWGKYLLGGWLVAALALSIVAGVNRLVLVVFALSVPYLYATFSVVFVAVASGGRASHMADRITAVADQQAYERVAVLCGDSHREAIREELEEREWSVTTYGSRHPLIRLFGRT
ncbi:hypothetical protein [Natronomonas gomsonensis]|uniref:hypothetical protein n=1 Tax=Natronomonas gomsonensis TaxID=1046043 RepID=UPI0015B97AEE|nr:hypothetical protein [Natronomonas gomsonensis]